MMFGPPKIGVGMGGEDDLYRRIRSVIGRSNESSHIRMYDGGSVVIWMTNKPSGGMLDDLEELGMDVDRPVRDRDTDTPSWRIHARRHGGWGSGF